MGEFQRLMRRWSELEPGRCGPGPFVRLFDMEHMQNVDEYDDPDCGPPDFNEKWDEMKIEAALRSAIEARGWNWALCTGGNGRYQAHITDADGKFIGEVDATSRKIPALALLAVYVAALEVANV